MSAPLIELSDQVTDLLNTVGAFTPALSAVRSYQPFYELTDLTAVKTTVLPISDRTIGRADREAWQHELTVRVAVQKKLADDNDTTKDTVVTLADAICEYVKENWPEDSDFELMAPTVASLMQHPLLQQSRLFSSGIDLIFWHYR